MKALLKVLFLISLGVTTSLSLSCCTCDDLDVSGTSAEPQILPCPFIIKVNKFAYETDNPKEYLSGKRLNRFNHTFNYASARYTSLIFTGIKILGFFAKEYSFVDILKFVATCCLYFSFE